ncbi:MurR/RpiR family transcriptional regulator [Anaerobium acetethylicum]|uniref:DNA-binding transcriptional regulator, MurR/RpiR family, contains HTH and SIS domains n=1 Tax=Anaerobium acetethylicum TaxID=1619234 RepID=A0A1D3TP51_9FIRM|nr:MurR/RpiR family transcriptional regulator [Anaerobium acetethylicum]SCP95145.1 DNA-binding transcriptional regulator, MurR/RpiR family, contains HTH and SIS domains [Anaerobium acetethylicum]
MNYADDMVVKNIIKVYDKLTNVEKNIAEFFLNNKEKSNFSSKSISEKLFVSEASLSRFAKKCGYKGFRELIYDYERSFENTKKNDSIDDMTKRVLDIYQGILNKSFKLVDESQMKRIATMLTKSSQVYVIGMGSSGIAADEFQLRFMRLGLRVEAISDSHRIKMNSALADEDTLLIGISISGKTREILEGMRIAKERGAKILFITGGNPEDYTDICDDVLRIASSKNLEIGTAISPQFPILVMVDIFYTYYLNTDLYNKSAKHTETLSALLRGEFGR